MDEEPGYKAISEILEATVSRPRLCGRRQDTRGDYQSLVVEGESLVEGCCARAIDNRPYGLAPRDMKKISTHISPAGLRVLSIRIAIPPIGFADIPLDEGDSIKNFSLRGR
jgi:hypothetical protein